MKDRKTTHNEFYLLGVVRRTLTCDLLSLHLLPWCFRYLELVKAHATTRAYQALADLAYSWCMSMKENFNVKIEATVLYR